MQTEYPKIWTRVLVLISDDNNRYNTDTTFSLIFFQFFRSLKAWTSDLSNKIKREFFQRVASPVLQHGCTTWSSKKPLVKKLNENYTRMLPAVLNKSRKQLPTNRHHIIHLNKTKKTNWARLVKRGCAHKRQSLWIHTHGHTSVGRPVKTFNGQLCTETECRVENLPRAMDDKVRWPGCQCNLCSQHDKITVMISCVWFAIWSILWQILLHYSYSFYWSFLHHLHHHHHHVVLLARIS